MGETRSDLFAVAPKTDAACPACPGGQRTQELNESKVSARLLARSVALMVFCPRGFMRETFFVGSHCLRCPQALVSQSAAALYSAVIDLRPVSPETDRSWFREPGRIATNKISQMPPSIMSVVWSTSLFRLQTAFGSGSRLLTACGMRRSAVRYDAVPNGA